MKVGIIVPDGLAPDGLIEGLRSAGVGVEVHVSHSPDKPALSPDRAGAFLADVSGYDLIHNLAGSLATATGALSGGWLAQGLQKNGTSALAAYRANLLGYALGGLALAVLFLGLSGKIEVGVLPGATKTPSRSAFTARAGSSSSLAHCSRWTLLPGGSSSKP